MNASLKHAKFQNAILKNADFSGAMYLFLSLFLSTFYI